MIDINLFVMEADAISSSAIRSLYLKVGNIIDKKRIYQLFNKTTEEEYEVYSKLSGGTVFINIEAIVFDWKIRRAFSIAQVPDMRNTSARYGKQIYDICNILFVDKAIHDRLQKYELVIRMHESTEEEKEIQEKIFSTKKEIEAMRKSQTKNIFYTLLLFSTFFIILTFYIFIASETPGSIFTILDNKVSIMPLIVIGISTLLSVTLSYINLFEITKDRRNNYKQLELYRKRLQDTMDKKEKLQDELNFSKAHIADIKNVH